MSYVLYNNIIYTLLILLHVILFVLINIDIFLMILAMSIPQKQKTAAT